LQSNQDEIYSQEERRFIKNVENIYVYPNFYKKTKKGNMVCRIVAADLSENKDFISEGVTFMKIINKSVQGFTVFLLKLSDGIHIGCRLFDKIDWNDCTMSEAGTLEQIADDISYIDEQEEFITYYTLFIEAIMPKDVTVIDYDEQVCRKRGVQLEYLSMLSQIELEFGVSIRREQIRYIDSFDNIKHNQFKLVLEWYIEELKRIKSTKVNTLEILFIAEEMEKIANATYHETQEILDMSEEEKEIKVNMQLIRDDLEAMIKMLKNQYKIS